MKMREIIWSRIVRSHLAWLGVCGLAFVGLGLLPRDFSRIIWIPLTLLVIAIANGYFMSKVRCLVCRYQFSTAVMFGLRQSAKKSRINYCPHFGVSLEQEVGANSSFKPKPLRGSA